MGGIAKEREPRLSPASMTISVSEQVSVVGDRDRTDLRGGLQMRARAGERCKSESSSGGERRAI